MEREPTRVVLPHPGPILEALEAAEGEALSLREEREDYRKAVRELTARAETAERERDRLKAEQAAAVCAWEEYARWPDLPSVPIGRVRHPDGREEEIALRPEQITGILHGIERHVRECLPFGVRAVEAAQSIDRVTEERDEARAALKPFADYAEACWAMRDDDTVLSDEDDDGVIRTITAADFRRATAALREVKP